MIINNNNNNNQDRNNKPRSKKRQFEASNTKTAKEKRINQALHKILWADEAEWRVNKNVGK